MASRRDFLKHLGFHLNPPPMSNNNTLPAELQKEIEQKALRFTKDEGYQKVFIAGATEYAQKYKKATDLLRKVLNADWVIGSHQITRSADLANEIKTFLDGTK